MLQCVAVCCGVLQCVAVCFSVLRCVAVCCSVLQCVALCCSVLQCDMCVVHQCTCVSNTHISKGISNVFQSMHNILQVCKDILGKLFWVEKLFRDGFECVSSGILNVLPTHKRNTHPISKYARYFRKYS